MPLAFKLAFHNEGNTKQEASSPGRTKPNLTIEMLAHSGQSRFAATSSRNSSAVLGVSRAGNLDDIHAKVTGSGGGNSE